VESDNVATTAVSAATVSNKVTLVMTTAIRYVERKTVRARIVCRIKNYRWPSAAAQDGERADAVLTKD